jgi:hypothetical protein
VIIAIIVIFFLFPLVPSEENDNEILSYALEIAACCVIVSLVHLKQKTVITLALCFG